MMFFCSQIDGTNPILNLTVNETLLDSGTIAVDLCKSDVGSGVASVDIYELIGTTTLFGRCIALCNHCYIYR